jgi:hypothetical protein
VFQQFSTIKIFGPVAPVQKYVLARGTKNKHKMLLQVDGDVHHRLDAGRILLPLAKFAVFNALKTKMTSSSGR